MVLRDIFQTVRRGFGLCFGLFFDGDKKREAEQNALPMQDSKPVGNIQDWEKCRTAIINSAQSYLREHHSKHSTIVSKLMVGQQGKNRANNLRDFVKELDLATHEGQKNLVAAVSAIRLSSSTLLREKMDSQLTKQEFINRDFCNTSAMAFFRLPALEKQLRQRFDGEKTRSPFMLRLKFGVGRS